MVPTPIGHGDWLQIAPYSSKLNWTSEMKLFLDPPTHARFVVSVVGIAAQIGCGNFESGDHLVRRSDHALSYRGYLKPIVW